MRKIIALLETASAPFIINDAFVAAVQAYLHEHLSDWADDFPDLKSTIEATWALIEREGVPEAGSIEVYREELRPADQIADKDYGSLGACWSWDINGAATCHHDNAYDDHGKDVQPVIFIGNIPLSSVDWVQTIAKNMVLKGEREINIRDGSTIQIEGQMTPGDSGYPVGENFSIVISNIHDF